MFTGKSEVAVDSAYRQGLSTKEFAKRYFVKPQSVRKQYCVKGSYFGIKPTKLKNGRLEWPNSTQHSSLATAIGGCHE